MNRKSKYGQANGEIIDVFIDSVIKMRGKQKRYARFGEKYREAKEMAEKKVDDIIAKLTDSQGRLF